MKTSLKVGLVITLTVLLASLAHAGVNQWTTNGPEGASVSALAVAPSDPQILYVSTNGGVFTSTNDGSQWSLTNSEPNRFSLRSLVVDPSNPQIVYGVMGFDGGILKSEDGGVRWAPLNLGGPREGIGAFTIDPTNPQILYVGTNNGILKSRDGGQTWSVSSTNVIAGFPINTIVVNPTSPQILYASSGFFFRGGIGGRVFSSEDGGETWTTSYDAPTFALALDPTNPRIVYAGTSRGVAKTTDGGAQWVDLPSPTSFIRLLVLDPSNPQTLYIFGGSADPTNPSPSGVFRSVDGGASWSTIYSGLFITALVTASTPAQALYLGNSDGIQKSTDSGATWTSIHTGLIATGVRALALDPTDPRVVYAGTYGNGGLFKSTDRGQTWASSNSGIPVPYINAIVIDPTNPHIVYTATGAPAATMLFKSVDGGKSWTAKTGPAAPGTQTLAIDPTNPQILYAGAAFWGVYKSTDAGESWQASGLNGLRVEALAIDSRQPQILYFAASSGNTEGIYSGGLWKSRDGGTSWTQLTSGLPDAGFFSIVIDYANSQTLYAGGQTGVFKSSDGGNHWVASSNGLPNWDDSFFDFLILALDPTNPLTLYLGSNALRVSGAERMSTGGVFKSVDGGQSWTDMNVGLTNTAVFALVVDPHNPRILHVGTAGGGVFDIGAEPSLPITLTSITPNSGPTSGGTAVAMSGTHFQNGASIMIGGNTATQVNVANPTTITATTPSGTAGTANVTVMNPGCSGSPLCAATLASAFTYVAPPPTLEISTSALDFGAVKIGKRRKRSFSVRNISNHTKTVNILLTDPFRLRSAASFTLKAGKRKTVKVRFVPTTAGAANGTVSVRSVTDSLQVQLTGSGFVQ